MVYAIPDQKTHQIVDILVRDLCLAYLSACFPIEELTHLMTDVCKALGIKKLNTTAYHPQCDGLVERFNRTLKSMLSFRVWQRMGPKPVRGSLDISEHQHR